MSQPRPMQVNAGFPFFFIKYKYLAHVFLQSLLNRNIIDKICISTWVLAFIVLFKNVFIGFVVIPWGAQDLVLSWNGTGLTMCKASILPTVLKYLEIVLKKISVCFSYRLFRKRNDYSAWWLYQWISKNELIKNVKIFFLIIGSYGGERENRRSVTK